MDADPRHELGRKGEAVAAKYYRQQGYALLDHNFRTRYGELDLVLYRDGVMVIAEVKTRSRMGIVAPRESVDRRKRQRLIWAAQIYLQNSPYRESAVRFDVVEVIPQGNAWQVRCTPNAFDCDNR